MCYPSEIHPDYFITKQRIEHHPLTFLLLPCFNLKDCVEEIVCRQMQRSYLNASLEKKNKRLEKDFLFLHH